MESLSELWTSWNSGVGTVVATIMATIALLRSMAKDIYQTVGSVSRWRAWKMLSGLYAKAKRLYRTRRAKSVMRRALQGKLMQIGIQEYANCLRLAPNGSSRSQLEPITPSKPSWFNDYYVATALESLSNDGSVVKSERYSLNSWPPDPVRYVFHVSNADIPAREQAVVIAANEKCKVYQIFDLCPRESRFDFQRSAETVSASETRFTEAYVLKDQAEPCDLCWEKESREKDMRILVEKITKYDLAHLMNVDILGSNGEFQAAVETACIEGQCPADPEVIRSIVRQAIGIREAQIELSESKSPHEWRQDHRENLVSGLLEFLDGHASE